MNDEDWVKAAKERCEVCGGIGEHTILSEWTPGLRVRVPCKRCMHVISTDLPRALAVIEAADRLAYRVEQLPVNEQNFKLAQALAAYRKARHDD